MGALYGAFWALLGVTPLFGHYLGTKAPFGASAWRRGAIVVRSRVDGGGEGVRLPVAAATFPPRVVVN